MIFYNVYLLLVFLIIIYNFDCFTIGLLDYLFICIFMIILICLMIHIMHDMVVVDGEVSSWKSV